MSNQTEREALVSWAERLRYVRRVLENWVGNSAEDRANAFWEVKALFKEIHTAAVAAHPPEQENAAARKNKNETDKLP